MAFSSSSDFFVNAGQYTSGKVITFVAGGTPVDETPGQLTIAWTGATPTMVIGIVEIPNALVLEWTGGIPGQIIMSPGQLKIVCTGNIPTDTVTIVDKPIIVSHSITCDISDVGSGFGLVTIPISSISGSVNKNSQSSLLLVCPDGTNYADIIADRIDGIFVINTIEVYSDGTTNTVTSSNFNIQTVTSDKGAKSWSISFRGTNSHANPTITSYVAYGVQILTTDGEGKRRVRLNYNADLKINDTLVVDGSDLTVGSITYTLSSRNQYMTVTEA